MEGMLSCFVKPTSSGVVGFSDHLRSGGGGGGFILPSSSSCLRRRSKQQLLLSCWSNKIKTWSIRNYQEDHSLGVTAKASASSAAELTKDQDLAPSITTIPVKEVGEEHDRIETLVSEIKEKFRAMNDGETSPSAYDTAWVARIPSAGDPSKPHFEMCLDWVLNNQMEDGSWGEPSFYLLYDRLVNTLACVLALRIWNTGEHQIAKGLEYLRDNMKLLAEESSSLITCGFELAFPWMLNEAKDLGLDLPYDLPCLQEIARLREKKIKRIPLEVMHSVHTTLLYTLEALQEVVQWDKIRKLQSRDGSFLSSPSATAVAYMKTGDKKCLEFLTKTVNRFGDNVPCQYPIDLLERIWAIDTIQRLGIDHHFRTEISDTLDYVYRNLGKHGVSWGRDNPVPDVDDTCMALRLLRLHGYPVSPDVLEYFRDDDGSFICFPGQTHQGVSDMYNLYRYSQTAFPGEKILKEATDFAVEFLTNSIKNNEANDKWSLKKSLGKEVERALRVPWRMSFERLEAREYIDQYGDNDVWIAKTIYWMYNVNDPRYLELAKLDFNRLQNLYKEEINSILKWWNGCGFDDPLVTEACPRQSHFAIAATLYEPEFSAARVAYTKCNCIENVLRDLFEHHKCIDDLNVICQAVEKWDPSVVRSLPTIVKATFMGMYDTLNGVVAEASKAQGKDMFAYLHDLRVKQMQYYLRKRQLKGVQHITSLKEYMEHRKQDLAVAIRTLPAMFLMGDRVQDYALRLLDHTSMIQDHLSSFLTLFVDLQKHKKMQEKCTSNAVSFCLKEGQCTEQEALGDLNTMMEDRFKELVHGCLKSSLVPRSCRRLMLEHARVVQYFFSDELGDDKSREEVINSAMDRMFTPI